MNYTPRPGSTPARVIEYLQELAPGEEATTGNIVKALGLNGHALDNAMRPALAAGLVRRRVDPDGGKFGPVARWSIQITRHDTFRLDLYPGWLSGVDKLSAARAARGEA